jgi:hypothetical protein
VVSQKITQIGRTTIIIEAAVHASNGWRRMQYRSNLWLSCHRDDQKVTAGTILVLRYRMTLGCCNKYFLLLVRRQSPYQAAIILMEHGNRAEPVLLMIQLVQSALSLPCFLARGTKIRYRPQARLLENTPTLFVEDHSRDKKRLLHADDIHSKWCLTSPCHLADAMYWKGVAAAVVGSCEKARHSHRNEGSNEGMTAPEPASLMSGGRRTGGGAGRQ